MRCVQVLAGTVSQENLDEGRVYPPLSAIRPVSTDIAVAIVELACQEKSASIYPEPEDKRAFVTSQLYSTDYDNFMPDFYDWPSSVSLTTNCSNIFETSGCIESSN